LRLLRQNGAKIAFDAAGISYHQLHMVFLSKSSVWISLAAFPKSTAHCLVRGQCLTLLCGGVFAYRMKQFDYGAVKVALTLIDAANILRQFRQVRGH
jgi:hypothetical protein